MPLANRITRAAGANGALVEVVPRRVGERAEEFERGAGRVGVRERGEQERRAGGGPVGRVRRAEERARHLGAADEHARDRRAVRAHRWPPGRSRRLANRWKLWHDLVERGARAAGPALCLASGDSPCAGIKIGFDEARSERLSVGTDSDT